MLGEDSPFNAKGWQLQYKNYYGASTLLAVFFICCLLLISFYLFICAPHIHHRQEAELLLHRELREVYPLQPGSAVAGAGPAEEDDGGQPRG